VKSYVLTTPATEDLWEIHDWYQSQDSVPAGEKILQAIADQCELLAKQPGLGRARSELGQGVRSFGVRPYLIFYRQAGSDIHVLRVLHGRRNITPSLFPD
jgi:toxin ParE1/3/4